MKNFPNQLLEVLILLRNIILPYLFVQSSDLGRNEVENFHLKFVLTALNGNFFLSLSYSTPLNINTIAVRVVLKELRKRNYLIFNKLKKKSQLC